MYAGSVYAPNVGKIFSCPAKALGVLIIDPATLAFDANAIRPAGGTRSGAGSSWASFAYANSTGLIYGAPDNHNYILVVNPITNTSDCSSFGPYPGMGQYRQAIYVHVGEALGTVVFIPAHAANGVLTLTVATNTTALAGL